MVGEETIGRESPKGARQGPQNFFFQRTRRVGMISTGDFRSQAIGEKPAETKGRTHGEWQQDFRFSWR